VAVAAVPVAAAAVVLASAATDQPHRYVRDAVVVEATREDAWDVLTDLGRYGEWNPYLVRASGRAVEGARVRFETAASSSIDAEVLIVRPLRKLEWESRVLAPGVLDHEQIFRVVPVDARRVRIVHEARWEGVLAPLARIEDDREGLSAMIRALARRAAAYQSSSE